MARTENDTWDLATGVGATATGWQPETTTAERMFAVHGLPFRRDEAVAGLLDANYTAAELVA